MDGSEQVPGGVGQVVLGTVPAQVGVAVFDGMVQHFADGLTLQPVMFAILQSPFMVRLCQPFQNDRANQVVSFPVAVGAADGTGAEGFDARSWYSVLAHW